MQMEADQHEAVTPLVFAHAVEERLHLEGRRAMVDWSKQLRRMPFHVYL